MHATTKPLSASSPAPPGKWASRLLTESETTLGRQELVNEFEAAQFEALGPWITGFEFGGNHYGGQYRADIDSRVLRFISTFRERLAASNRGRDQPLRRGFPGIEDSATPDYLPLTFGRSSLAPKYSQRCNAMGTLPFFQTKSWKPRRLNFSPCFRRASASNCMI